MPATCREVETATCRSQLQRIRGTHHFAADVVYFYMSNGNQRVRCGVTRLALELLEPDLPPTKQGRIQAFKQRRARIERAASAKFDRDSVVSSIRPT